MLIHGAGGHAKVVVSILSACGERVTGVFDDNRIGLWQPGAHVIRPYTPDFKGSEKLIIAIGNNQDRKRIADSVCHAFGKAIHPAAIVDNTVVIGEGTVIVHGAIVQAGSCIGDHVIVNTGAIVDHDCLISDFVHIASAATLCGSVRVGECTLVGAGSVVAPGIAIGKECVIGAGAVVVRDVPDYAKVVGNPARVII
ncbi:acetyltransferase [Dyadobacter beijingensis]|uniref:Acetyltransferase n=1 Tax=Dyadobacter beijingensis TaxID=365489 RepID=A0ABQ2IG05_9BACT|nr:acetyltransferase [Dyadobacter beijingensis]GGN08676.1 acetyltransferase [Dyadobacter beijingensis]